MKNFIRFASFACAYSIVAPASALCPPPITSNDVTAACPDPAFDPHRTPPGTTSFSFQKVDLDANGRDIHWSPGDPTITVDASLLKADPPSVMETRSALPLTDRLRLDTSSWVGTDSALETAYVANLLIVTVLKF
jgi:hypothetical protein